jgi:hypothetical protein
VGPVLAAVAVRRAVLQPLVRATPVLSVPERVAA